MTKYNWPSREQWAKQLLDRDPLWAVGEGWFDGELKDRASPAEVAELINWFETRWTALGKELVLMNKKHGHLLQQKGEGFHNHYHRQKQMTESEREACAEIYSLKHRRHEIKARLGDLKEGLLPHSGNTNYLCEEDDHRIMHLIKERCHEAWQAAVDAKREEFRNTRVDDAAWQKELERRQRAEEADIVPHLYWPEEKRRAYNETRGG